MGKARRARQKLHLPASGVPRRPEPDAEAVPEAVPVAAPPPPSGASPFAGLQIPPEALRQRLPDFDARSVRSEAARSVRSTKSTVRGQAAMKKKDKRKVRREAFMQSKDRCRLLLSGFVVPVSCVPHLYRYANERQLKPKLSICCSW